MDAALGHAFRDGHLRRRALTHRSHGLHHNERLEFLGDAVLNLVVSQLLFHHFPAASEGDMSRMRAHLVREASLHQLALSLGLSEHILMSDGEARGGGAQRPSILADAVEALIGAVHLDAGFEAARAVVARLFEPMLAGTQPAGRWDKDAKTALQEWLQARKLPLPAYRIAATQGKAHAQTFQVECLVSALSLCTLGEGPSRRTAEQAAAAAALAQLQDKP